MSRTHKKRAPSLASNIDLDLDELSSLYERSGGELFSSMIPTPKKGPNT